MVLKLILHDLPHEAGYRNSINIDKCPPPSPPFVLGLWTELVPIAPLTVSGSQLNPPLHPQETLASRSAGAAVSKSGTRGCLGLNMHPARAVSWLYEAAGEEEAAAPPCSCLQPLQPTAASATAASSLVWRPAKYCSRHLCPVSGSRPASCAKYKQGSLS